MDVTNLPSAPVPAGSPPSEWIETEERKRLFAVKNQTVPLEILDNREEFLKNVLSLY